jgi:hypothetical protein
MTNEASEREALTDGEIDSLWLTRPSIHGGDLTLQLRDFARAVESAVRAAAPAVQAPVAWRRREKDGWWVYYETPAWSDLEPLYAAAPTAAQPNTDGVEPCPRGADKPEPTCTNRHQCWEPCGELGKSEEHARAVREPNIAFDGAQEVLGHKVGCPALGGYGACLCGAAGVKGPDHG